MPRDLHLPPFMRVLNSLRGVDLASEELVDLPQANWKCVIRDLGFGAPSPECLLFL